MDSKKINYNVEGWIKNTYSFDNTKEIIILSCRIINYK